VSILVVALLLIGAGSAAAAWYYTAGPGTYSQMPDVVGTSEQGSVAALESSDLRAETSRVFSETEDEGNVVAASEEAGDSLLHGTTVELEVSRGPERYSVPDLTRMTVPEATAELEATSLVLGQVSEEYDSDVGQGQILSSSPTSSDEQVAPDTAVDVVVSAGPEPVEIPDVTGMTTDEASERLSDAGFDVERDPGEVNDPDIEEGAIVRQEPSGGQGLPGETVRVTVSAGPERVIVPRVIGMPFEEAEKRLEDLGLEVQKEDNALELLGTVRKQSVEAGEMVDKDSEVVLTVI